MNVAVGVLFVVAIIWWTMRTQTQSDRHSEPRKKKTRRESVGGSVEQVGKSTPKPRAKIMASARNAMLEDMKERAKNLATYKQRASPAFAHHRAERADELEEEYAPDDADFGVLERKHRAEIMDWWNSTNETERRRMLAEAPPQSMTLERRQKRAWEKNDCSFFEECSRNGSWAGCSAESLEEGFAGILIEFQNCQRLPMGMPDDYRVVRLFEKGPSPAGLGAFHRQEWSGVVTAEIEPVLDDDWKNWVEHHEHWDAEKALHVALAKEGFDYGEFLSEIQTYLESDEFITAVRLVYDNARRKSRRENN